MEPVIVPIDGTLDLHTFAAGELKGLLQDYIDACLESAIYDLRIIHGKGSGILRARVRSLLETDPRVEAFGDAPADAGGWGATLITLRRFDMAKIGKILVVDNEPDQLAMMKKVLGRIGYAARTSDNSHEALNMVVQEAFDLVFIDLIMPEIDGTELCEQIKQIRPDLLVFAYSGHVHLYRPEQLKRAGFDGAISKPATMEEISAALATIGKDKR